MNRLSIIITFYDETAFVDMAVASVLSQPIDGLELVIVNDNPETFGPDYFDGLGLPDSVQVVHHPHNKGLSAARNTGIAASSGAIIGFLDADDYYVSGGLQRQLDLAEVSGADVTHASCFLSRQGSPEVDVLRRDRLLFAVPNVGAGLIGFEEAQFITSSWASLYRRDFLDNFDLRFDEEQPKFEDRLFVLEAVTAARNIVTLGAATRVWRQRAGSISVTQTDPYIHRLQIQLIEKCLSHIRGRVAAGRLPPRIEKRELFNTVGRLIWDMDIIAPIVEGKDAAYAEFAERIVTLLGDDSFGQAIFEDAVLVHISRVGMRTRKGFISRAAFFEMHKALRTGDFKAVQDGLAEAKQLRAPERIAPPAPVDADLTLHLGMHKTGSTFLQHHLRHYRDDLLHANVLFPKSGLSRTFDATARSGAFPGHQGLIRALRTKGTQSDWSDLAREVTTTGARHVVLSCENMLFPLNHDRGETIATLLDQLSMFRSVRCVAYVRRPDSYVEALYKEIVANGRRMGSRSLQEFCVDHAATLTNLPALFAPFEAASGQPVQLLDFDAAAKSGTLWSQFCIATGLPDDLPVIDVPTYPSLGRNGTQAARMINTLITSEPERLRVLGDLFRALPPEPDAYTILSPQERLHLIERFEQASAGFAAERGYAPDFAKLRKSVPKRWKPAAGMDMATMTAVQQARLRAEEPQPDPPQATVKHKKRRKKSARKTTEPALMTLRIKPRPWVLAVLNWRPFGAKRD